MSSAFEKNVYLKFGICDVYDSQPSMAESVYYIVAVWNFRRKEKKNDITFRGHILHRR